ncbi:MAG TPA: J domain-containing protein, partial [Kofleriaceae bacterium]|nr:J domain-containing protein [Kofleriaceae bacterium]
AEAEPIARELSGRAAAVRAEHRGYDERVHAAFAAIERNPRLRRPDRLAARALYQWLQSAGAITEAAVDTPSAPEDADERAAEPHRALRPTFLRLASEYHPDKTTDDALRVARTEIMKELNRAYAGGDVSHLLELERTLGERAGVAPATLEAEVAALKTQLRDLSQEMRRLRAHYEGAIVIEFRRLAEAGCADPVAAIIDQLRLAADQTRRLAELIERFRDRDIDIDRLHDGPEPGDDGGWLAEVFASARQSRDVRTGTRRAGRRRPR